MTTGLVGSEMCIRDSSFIVRDRMDKVEAPSMSVKTLKGSRNKRHNYYVRLKAWKMCKSAGFIWLFDQYLHKRSTFLLHISAPRGAAILHVLLCTNEEQKRDWLPVTYSAVFMTLYSQRLLAQNDTAPKVLFSQLSNVEF